ncbi:MAG: hypothetical protein ACREX8_02385 [Gammaproteobacteria bacterium]
MIVIVNYRTGGHCTLSGPARDLWRALAATGDADPAIIGIPATAIVNQMIRRNLLTEVTTARPWAPCPVTVAAASWGTIERDACLAPLPPTPRNGEFAGRSPCSRRSLCARPDGQAAASPVCSA